MKSSLRCIEIRLKEYAPVCYLRSPDRAHIRSFEAWEDAPVGERQQREDTLYYIDASQIETSMETALPCNLICCGAEVSCPDGHNLIRLGVDISYEDLVPQVEQTLEEIRQYAAMMSDLLQIMDRSNCLEEMVNCYSRHMRVSTAILDTSFKSIALSDHSDFQEYFTTMYEQTGQEEILSEDSLIAVENMNILNDLYSEVPYLISDYDSMTGHPSVPERAVSGIYLPIRYDGNLIAFMTVISYERKLDEADASIAQDAARLFSLVMLRDDVLRIQTNGTFSALLHDIITFSITDEEVIRNRFRSLKWPLCENLYVAVLIPEEGKEDSLLLRRKEIQRQFAEITQGSLSDIYQDTLYFLISRKTEEVSSPFRVRRLELFLKANHALLGLSSVFHAPSKIHQHFIEARSSVFVGLQIHPENRIYLYDSYTAEISAIAVTRNASLEPESFIHPVIRFLHGSSRAADRDLLDTLEQYLFSLRDVSRTCEVLHIHRSTLFYRLNKLKDLLGEDALHDGRTVQQLMNSFTMLHWLERQKKE